MIPGTTMADAPALDPANAARFARTALVNIGREYPNKLDQVLDGPGDLRAPRALHPLFYGSYDWHSSVHMHWLLVRLLRIAPRIGEAPEIIASLDRGFTPEAVAGELSYLGRPSSGTFERPYGWAWLLALSGEIARLASERHDLPAARWSAALTPLADAFVARFLHWLPKASLPIRAGTHANSAFALDWTLDYADAVGHERLGALARAKALQWFGHDAAYPIGYEPGGEDFLSPGLMEAALMQRTLSAQEHRVWFARFLPDWTPPTLGRWLEPARVPDRNDARLVHLDGLNLSRAWCWRRLARAFALEDERRALAEAAAARHLDASLAQAVGSHYVAEHWLATFAVLALTV